MRSIRIVILTALVAMTNEVNSQQEPSPKSPEQKAQEATDSIVRHLGLSDIQAEQVYQLSLQSAQRLEPYAQSAREAKRALMEARKQEAQRLSEQLKSVLTPEQFAEFERLKAERHARMAEKRSNCRRQH